MRIEEKEKKRRLPAGTLVIATCQFSGENPGVSVFLVLWLNPSITSLYPYPCACNARRPLIPPLQVIPVTIY